MRSLRGFRDALPPESERIAWLEGLSRTVLGRYGFRELRLPTLEAHELFVKSTGETTDIVEKEMFTLEDQGGRRMALRPEGTPGAVRAYLEAGLPQKSPRQKLFYIGSMFRAERPQAGRFREFVQVGAETFANAAPAADAELILALADLLAAAGLTSADFALHLNSLGCDDPSCRPAYRKELLAHLVGVRESLCENCRRRMERNPLRCLDCKGDAPRLREEAPRLTPCGACRAHFEQVRDLVMVRSPDGSGLSPVVDPHLVRGLDYYTRTVFEFKVSSLGAQDAVAAGGRYDGLVRSMGGPDTPAVGWALGVERTLKAVEGKERLPGPLPVVFVATQKEDPEQARQAFQLMQALRHSELENVSVTGGFFDRSLKAQLREADGLGSRFAIILGEDEVRTRSCTAKDMGLQSQERVSQAELPEYLSRKFGERH